MHQKSLIEESESDDSDDFGREELDDTVIDQNNQPSKILEPQKKKTDTTKTRQ